MPLLALLLTLLALHSAPARADGFFDPPEPTPERRAELAALCSRLEALGLPAIPPEAEWVRYQGDALLNLAMWYPVSSVLNPVPFFDEPILQPVQNLTSLAWQWTPENGSPVLCGVTGFLVAMSENDSVVPDRLARTTAGLRQSLLQDAAERTDDSSGASVVSILTLYRDRHPLGECNLGPVVFFCAQLHRHGESAQADALLQILDAAGVRPKAEEDAFRLLCQIQTASLLRSSARTNDLPAFIAAIRDSIARCPYPKTNPYDHDPREELLKSARRRLETESSIPGVPDDLQPLALALDRASYCSSKSDNRRFGSKIRHLPWLLRGAVPDDIAVGDAAVQRIPRMGPRAFDILLPLLDDEALVDGNWDAGHDVVAVAKGLWNADVSRPFYTRGQVAKVLLGDILPDSVGESLFHGKWPDKSERDARLRDLVGDGDDERVFLPYLAPNRSGNELDVFLGNDKVSLLGADAFLFAWLASRAAGDPLPGLENALENIVRNTPLREADSSNFDKEPDPFRTLFAASIYIASRGEAAAPFRDRILAVCKAHAGSWKPPAGPMVPKDAFGRSEDETVTLTFDKPRYAQKRGRAWYAAWSKALASIPLGPSDEASLDARSNDFAQWFRAMGLAYWNADDDDSQDTTQLPPPPALLKSTFDRIPGFQENAEGKVDFGFDFLGGVDTHIQSL